MTGLLKDLMSDKAEHAGAPHLDLDAIIADGRQAGTPSSRADRCRHRGGCRSGHRRRRGRPRIVNTSKPDPVQPPSGPDFSTSQPTYAVGSTIHYGATSIDVTPQTIAALVRTDQGFVFSSPDGEVYFTDGEVNEPIGTVTPRWRGAPSWPTAPMRPGSIRAVTHLRWSSTTRPNRPRCFAPAKPALSADNATPSLKRRCRRWTVRSLYWHNSTGVVVSDVSR